MLFPYTTLFRSRAPDPDRSRLRRARRRARRPGPRRLNPALRSRVRRGGPPMPKAAVCPAINAPLEVVDVALDGPKAGEVRVRMGASGVCHSDLSVVNGTLLSPLPSVLGHEGAGVVEEVGEGVDELLVGDHVVISWVPQCGDCYFCGHDQPELCEAGSAAAMSGGMLDMTSRFSV